MNAHGDSVVSVPASFVKTLYSVETIYELIQVLDTHHSLSDFLGYFFCSCIVITLLIDNFKKKPLIF